MQGPPPQPPRTTHPVDRRVLLARLATLAAGGYMTPRAVRITPVLASHKGGSDGHCQHPGHGPPAASS